MGTAIVAFLQLYIVYRQKMEKSITFVDFSKKYQGFFGFCTLNYMRFAGEYSQGQCIWANLYFGQDLILMPRIPAQNYIVRQERFFGINASE
ncbi:MAG: hypothetical protein IKT63_06280 [Oscillospiraceae bacterium]|nr:hypothetical protein [Oscillospiraceae bacterium]